MLSIKKLAIALAILCSACADERESWSYVYTSIVDKHCTTSACHSSLSTAGNLDLHDRETAYAALAGRDCDDTTTAVGGYVDTMMPTESLLSSVLRLEGPRGMPPNNRLSDTEIALIERWMQAGARCD